MITHGDGMESEEISERARGRLIVSTPPCVSFFDSKHMQERLLYHAGQWVGTPFVAHAGVRGAGVDCVNLVAQIYIACEFLNEFRPPAYAMDGGKHNERSQLIRWIEDSHKFARVQTPAPGDTLCFLWRGQSEHHAGLMLHGDDFMHVMERRKVQVSSLTDRTYQRTLTAIYRPLV
jgi:cell wall-associated NlpC family hydrolase